MKNEGEKMIKKSNVMAINFSDKAILCLQKLGIIDGNKKSKDKRLSSFVSERVIDYIINMRTDDIHAINVEHLKNELRELQEERDVTESKMLGIAEMIRKENSLIKTQNENN